MANIHHSEHYEEIGSILGKIYTNTPLTGSQKRFAQRYFIALQNVYYESNDASLSKTKDPLSSDQEELMQCLLVNAQKFHGHILEGSRRERLNAKEERAAWERKQYYASASEPTF